MSERATASIWDDGAWESCPRCWGRYAYELEVRCHACDGPQCPLCVVTVRERSEVFCADCESCEAEEEG